MLNQFDGEILFGPSVTRKTQEGPAAVNEAIQFLNSAEPVSLLEWNADLAKAARDHVQDVGPKGLNQYEGTDDSTS